MFSRLSAAAILAGLSVTGTAQADHGPRSQVVFAPVIDVEPIVRQVTVNRPREECWLETTVVPNHAPGHGSAGSIIAGGLIGGVIGHQFGRGRSNDAMTVLGTLVGSAIAGDAAAKRARYAAGAGYGREVTTQRCEIVNDAYLQDRIEGYHVTYEYMGQRYATVMPRPPRGDRVRLHVTIEAAGGY